MAGDLIDTIYLLSSTVCGIAKALKRIKQITQNNALYFGVDVQRSKSYFRKNTQGKVVVGKV